MIRPEGPWGNVDHVGIETLHSVDWVNHERTHKSTDDLTPVEVEHAQYARTRLVPTG